MSQPNGYGTAGPNAAAAAAAAVVTNHVDEEQPLLNGHTNGDGPHPKSLVARIHKAANAEVSRDWADVVLIFCYIITGLLDSASISIWGSFVSMQTGNTVYIGLGLAAPTQSTRWIKSGTSLVAFSIGSFVFARLHRRLFGGGGGGGAPAAPRARGTLLASFAAQAALCAAAAAIVTWGPGGYGPNDLRWDVLLPIALVAFQACGQAVASRALGYNALTSVVLTSIYCDLFSDPALFAPRNPERNRRLGAPLMLLLGALAGGLLARSEWGVAAALWTAAALKAGIVVVWILWPGKKEGE